MYNIFAWNKVDGYKFMSFQEDFEAVAFCNQYSQPQYVPCAAEFADAITEAKENILNTTVLLITEGAAWSPDISLVEWGTPFAWCNQKENDDENRD